MRIDRLQLLRQHLEFLTAAPLNKRTTYEMVDDLFPPSFSYFLHEAANPRADTGRPQENSAALKQVEHQVKVFQFLDGNGIQPAHATVELTVFHQAQSRGGGLAFEVTVIDQD